MHYTPIEPCNLYMVASLYFGVEKATCFKWLQSEFLLRSPAQSAKIVSFGFHLESSHRRREKTVPFLIKSCSILHGSQCLGRSSERSKSSPTGLLSCMAVCVFRVSAVLGPVVYSWTCWRPGVSPSPNSWIPPPPNQRPRAVDYDEARGFAGPLGKLTWRSWKHPIRGPQRHSRRNGRAQTFRANSLIRGRCCKEICNP